MPSGDEAQDSQADPGEADADADSEAPTEASGEDPTSGDSGQSSLGFVPPEDLSGISTCDPFAQDCEPGEKCVPYGSTGGNWDANKCVPVLGDGKVGEPCTYDGTVAGTDSCDASSLCWNVGDVDGEQLGTCHPFCTGSGDDPMCPGGSTCSISCDGSLTVCLDECDPIAQDCLGLGCYWTGGSFTCIWTAGDGIELGQPCGFVNDCKPGMMCTDADVVPGCEGSACCAAFCELGVGSCAAEGTACVPFFEEGSAPATQEQIGICIEVV